MNGSLPDEYLLHRALDRLQIDDGSPISPKTSRRRHEAPDVTQSTDDDETSRRGADKEDRKRKLFRFRPSLFSPAKDEASKPTVTEGITMRSRPDGASADPLAALKRSSLHLESNNNDSRSLHTAFAGGRAPLPLQKSASAVIRPSARDTAASRLRLNDYEPTFGIYSRADGVRSPVTGHHADPGPAGGVSSRLDDVYFGSASARRYRRIREEAKTRGGRPAAAKTTAKVDSAALPSVCCAPVLSANRAKLLKANSPFGRVSVSTDSQVNRKVWWHGVSTGNLTIRCVGMCPSGGPLAVLLACLFVFAGSRPFQSSLVITGTKDHR